MKAGVESLLAEAVPTLDSSTGHDVVRGDLIGESIALVLVVTVDRATTAQAFKPEGGDFVVAFVAEAGRVSTLTSARWLALTAS